MIEIECTQLKQVFLVIMVNCTLDTNSDDRQCESCQHQNTVWPWLQAPALE